MIWLVAWVCDMISRAFCAVLHRHLWLRRKAQKGYSTKACCPECWYFWEE